MSNKVLFPALMSIGFICCLATLNPIIAQNVSINADGSAPDSSAMLDVNSTTKGLLIPRMTLVERDAIISPANSLLIYQTDNTPGYYFNSGIPVNPFWVQLSTPADNLGNHIATTNIQLGSNYLSGDGGNEGIYVSNTGRVGIGNTTPNAPLQFSNTLDNRKLVLFEGSNNDHEFFGFGVNGSSLRYQANAPGDHIFYTSSSATTSAELMRIGGNGNVGIGTSTAAYRLDVNGAARLSNLRINTNALQFGAALEVNTRANIIGAFNPNLFIGPNGTDYMQVSYNTSGNYGRLFTPGTRHIVLEPGGFVGIGTATPTFTLTVNGLAAKPGGGTWIATSDIRLKDHIKEYSKGLSELLLLKPIEYRYKENNVREHDSHIVYQGFSAQAVQKVFPEAIIESEDGYLNLDMNAILVAYLNAIKELNQKIDVLEKKLDEFSVENTSPEK